MVALSASLLGLLVAMGFGCGDSAKQASTSSSTATATSTMSATSKPAAPSALAPAAPAPSGSTPTAARPGDSPEALFAALREVVEILDNAEDCPKMKAAIDAYRTRYPADALEGMAKRLIMEPDDPGPKRRGNERRIADFREAHPVEVAELKARREAQRKRFADLHKECAELESILSDVGVLLSIAGS